MSNEGVFYSFNSIRNQLLIGCLHLLKKSIDKLEGVFGLGGD